MTCTSRSFLVARKVLLGWSRFYVLDVSDGVAVLRPHWLHVVKTLGLAALRRFRVEIHADHAAVCRYKGKVWFREHETGENLLWVAQMARSSEPLVEALAVCGFRIEC